MRLPQPPLLVITDRRQARGPLEAAAAALFAGGCRWLSLREKDLDPAGRIVLLRRLVALGKSCGAAVTVHEDIAAALAARAAGIHLPAGGSPAAARRCLGPAALIGLSAHGEADIKRAEAESADYVTLSPIYPSMSKPGYGPALGLEMLARLAARTPLPVVALGGLDAARATACLAAGASGIAIMGAAMTAADPAALLSAFMSAGRGLPLRTAGAIVAPPDSRDSLETEKPT